MRWYRTPRAVQRGALILFGGFVMAPLVWVLLRSFENPVPYKAENFFMFLYRYLSPGQYIDVLFHNLEYWISYWNTLFLTVPTLLLAMFLVSLAAYGLTTMGDKAQNRILAGYAVLALLPMQMLLVPQLIALSNMHLRGSRLAVILIGSFTPWHLFFLHRLCRRVPDSVFEMARIEGAGELTIFCRIALPQMRMGLLVFGIIVSADLWGMVEEPLVYIQDITKYPLSVLFAKARGELSYAGAVLLSLPVVVLFLNGIWGVMEKEGIQG